MKRPNFEPIISQNDAAEMADSKPIETFIPNQSYTISELVKRFETGQRLNVKMNFKPEDEITNGCIYEETFEEAAPTDIHDVADVEQFKREHDEHKREFSERQKKKKKTAASENDEGSRVPQGDKQKPASDDAPAGA